MMMPNMTLGKSHSKEHFSDVPDDLKRHFFYMEESCSDADLTLHQKNVS